MVNKQYGRQSKFLFTHFCYLIFMMFTFGFSNPEPLETGGAPQDIQWLDHSEVHLPDIRPLANLDNVTPSTFKAGDLQILNIPTVKAIEQALASGSAIVKAAESSHTDLLPGQYEGGMKIWECTRDLIDLLVTLSIDWRGKRVLDLGCGAGLLGLFALLKGATVVFHDYNKEVIELLAGQNVLLNDPLITADRVQFHCGDWASFLNLAKSKSDYTFDYILTSETIYNPSNYSKLHDVIAELLSPEGTCYLAGKSIYFGVGGCIKGFLDHLNNKGRLGAKMCWSTSQGVSREILEISRLSNHAT